MTFNTCAVALGIVLSGLLPLSAQQTAAVVVVDGSAAKRATAVRVKAGAIRLDGRLDDDAWGRAEALTDFVMKEPTEGGTPTDRLEVRFSQLAAGSEQGLVSLLAAGVEHLCVLRIEVAAT